MAPGDPSTDPAPTLSSVSADLFHLRVPLAAGTAALLPLRSLSEVDPVAHAAALAKYDDTPERRRLRDTRIPVVDRLWTEVVFLSPVHPHAIWRTWWEITGRERGPMEFWAVPATSLPAGAAWLDRTITATGDPIDSREARGFDAARFQTMMTTTERNRAWLTELAASGRSGAWFHGIPHVVVPGPVAVADAPVVDWRDTP